VTRQVGGITLIRENTPLVELINQDVVKLRPEDKQSLIASLALRSANVLDRLLPDDHLLQHLLLPKDGGLEPFPAGTSSIDLRSGTVQKGSNGPQIIIEAEPTVRENIRSAVFFADAIVDLQASPGLGLLTLFPGVIVQEPARYHQQITLTSNAPFLFLASFGTSALVGKASPVTTGQLRISTTALTKVAAAAAADSLAAILFVPQYGTKTLTQATYGVNFINSVTVGQKLFFVRNLGPGAVDVQIFGALNLVNVLTLDALGAANGYMADTDTGATPTNIASGDAAVMETGIPWGVIQLHARVATAEAAGQTATILVEYYGAIPGVRG